MIWLRSLIPPRHALDCKLGSLFTARHNKPRYGVADLAGKAFKNTHVHKDPIIFVFCAVKRPKAKPARSKATSATPPLEATEQKGDLLIRCLCQNGTDSVNDIRVMNTDARCHLAKTQ